VVADQPSKGKDGAPDLPGNVAAVFPPDDRLGVAVLSLCMAGNDVEYAAFRAADANPPDHPDPDVTHHRRFYYLIRIAQGHLFEAIAALRAWEQSEPEFRKLIQNLDAAGRKAASRVRGLEQRIGSKALETVRHSTFHYPAPCAGLSELGLVEAIEREADLPAALDLSDEAGAPFRFADQLAMSMALANFDDGEIEGHIAAIIEGSGAFVRLVKATFVAYCEKRKIGHEIVD
jgi:hypothetical protein